MLTLRQMRCYDRNTIEKAVAACDHPIRTKPTNFTHPDCRGIERHALDDRLVNICLTVRGRHDGDHGSAIHSSARRIKFDPSRLSDGTAHRSSLARHQNISTERGRASPPFLAQGSSTSYR